MEIIEKYFPNLTERQRNQLDALQELYAEWNEQINVISRKEIDLLYERHVLHSLAIARFIDFRPGTTVLDLGTGGGFPGVPLSILFPDTQFTLIDSIAKKIKVAESISETCGIGNSEFVIGRVEQLKERFDFIISRAVAPMEQLYRWTNRSILDKNTNSKANGYILLKGGDLRQEKNDLLKLNRRLTIEEFALSDWFEESFFETKKLIHIY